MSDVPASRAKKSLKSAMGSIRRAGAALKRLKVQAPSPAAAGTTFKERRLARRTTSGLRLVLSDRIDFVNPQHWDALAAQTVFLSRPYLRVLEEHGPGNVEPRYAMAYDSTCKPVAIMLFQRVNVDGEQLRKPRTKRSLLDKPVAGLQENLLLCGNLLVWGARAIALAPGVDAALVWQGVGEAAYRLRRADKLLGESDVVMVKDYAAGEAVTKESLRLLGYRSVETEPDMVLSLKPEWTRFEDYLASLTSGYRSNAKKLQKDCATAGIALRVIDATEMQARQDEIHALYEQVHHGQSLRLATLEPSYLPALAEALGPRFVCRVAEREGRLVGFVTSVSDGATAIGYYIGYDRATNAEAPVYLTLLQSTVEDAIGFRAQRLSLGRTALEPKAKLGCQPEPLACAVRHRVSALNLLVSALVRTAAHDEPPQRSPFKKEQGAAEAA
ncbi:MAG TPA: GNAT family N-acetyltransferase [Ideonella sp.]|uniref:GNAT family N-acetyltransferase n=1 Tax=Ideonella sp. TaxID=1929293 RepID=UPI002E3267E9|nr:GNAT family N-acetyltransferase [Ideonella sp.]HEX5683572.1 GNAT family N-acetyltransferase [Ideonella sp.]